MAQSKSQKNYWLMKSEPDAYSIEDFKKDKTTLWDGIRNYQARNIMMNDMQVGDEFIFYHSNAKPPGAAGLGTIAKPAQPDPTQFDKKSKYFDEKSPKDKPRWHCVTCKYKSTFKRFVPLPELKEVKSLSKMMLLKKGTRLSIQPVSKQEFETICKLGSK